MSVTAMFHHLRQFLTPRDTKVSIDTFV